MWNTKCIIRPVTNGGTGILTKSLKTNLEAIQGSHSIDSLQQRAVLATSHIINESAAV
jgi:hypothetical protein